jgi:VWFA-related protein
VPTENGPGYTFKAYSEEVIVDVVVNDARGEPVRNLSRDHFQITEDGKPEKFRFFQESGSAHPAEPAVPLPEHVYTNVAGREAAGPVVILLLDALNTPMKDQQYMRRQMLQSLKLIPAGTRVALFVLDPGLRQFVGLTTDHSGLATALSGTKGMMPPGLLDSSMTWEEGAELAQAQAPGVRVTEAWRSARRKELRTQFTLEAFEALGKYLSGFPGRKSVLWFSGSFPLDIAAVSLQVPRTSAGKPSAPSAQIGAFIYADFTAEVHRVSSLLAASRVAVYPVDGRGVGTDSSDPFINADQTINFDQLPKASDDGQVSSARTNSAPPTSEAEALNRALTNLSQEHADYSHGRGSEFATMTQIATETGGEAFFNSNDLKGFFGKAIRDASSYYEISYVPDHPRFDEKNHKIQVKIDIPNAKISYRQGYFADDPNKHRKPAKPESDPLKAELKDGAPQSTQIQFYAKVLPVAPQPNLSDRSKRIGQFGANLQGPVVRCGIDWLVDLANIETNVLENGDHVGKVTVAVTVYDTDGKVRNAMVNTADFNLTPQRFAQMISHGMPMYQQLDLPRKDVAVRLAIIDRTSGKTGSFEVPLLLKSGNRTGPGAGR